MAFWVAASVLAVVLAGSIGNVRAALAQESSTDPTGVETWAEGGQDRSVLRCARKMKALSLKHPGLIT